jgi:predicted metal-dependent phosphoesterase TrpH
MKPSASNAGLAPAAKPEPAASFADLHLHSLFSDGTFTPEELAQRGAQLGLVAMALTDHDSVEGCERMAQACQALGIEFITGAELTAEWNGHEVHFLGYFLDVHQPNLLTEIKKFQTVRQERIREMVSKLNNLGVPLRAESVFELANCHSPGRPHVARALAQEGLCDSVDEAFERFLKKGRPAWVPKFKISALDAMSLIHQAGGLAVLAHPGLNHCDQVIPRLVTDGLDGLECFHSKQTSTQSEYYLALAKRLRLAVTGGSDCHGFSKGKPLIGGVKLPAVYLDLLKQARRS